MAIFARLANGWQVAKASISVLNAHKQLIILPIMSYITIGVVLALYYFTFADNYFGTQYAGDGFFSMLLRLCAIASVYIIVFFLVVFFNMAIIHCANLHLQGEDVSIGKGLQFSLSRTGIIFRWAVFSATIGMIFRMLSNVAGPFVRALMGAADIAWNVVTWFVVPVIAYENVTPMQAIKRSAAILSERWGSGISANFSIALLVIPFFLVFAVIAMGVSARINDQAGIMIFAFGACAMIVISSTLHSIFISILYRQITTGGDHLDTSVLGNLFVER